MVKFRVSCQIKGNYFSPKKVMADLGLVFSEEHEEGTPIRKGPNKGKLLTYGYAELAPPKEIEESQEDAGFEWLIGLLSEKVESLREYGAKEIDLDLAVFYDVQCNFSFSPDVLAKAAGLGVPLWVSCYQIDHPDEL